MTSVSPWAMAASNIFADGYGDPIFEMKLDAYVFQLFLTTNALWMAVSWPKGGRVLFRVAYAPGEGLALRRKSATSNSVHIHLSSMIGTLEIAILVVKETYPVLRYTTTLTPIDALSIPYWPRDVIFPGMAGNAAHTSGKVHVKQAGTRSGQLYVSMTRPKAGSLLYLHNLTALADYCQQTGTFCKEVVGGEWPELGFALPPSNDKFLAAGKKVTIADALVAFDPLVPGKEEQLVQQYLEMLAALYLHLPKPATSYKDWPVILKKGLHDLISSHGCWSTVKGKPYLNAYVCDYKTPPEIMVQLAVLLPLLDYVEWSGDKLDVMRQIKKSIASFYDEKRKTMMRWLPAAADRLEGEEEQKQPLVMDSWYLHHPLLNLSRLALKGDQEASALFLGSIDFMIRVARHFKYRWPVFYHMDTLEVVKAETQPGKGGEKDVAGLYAHVMLQAWELTNEPRYLREAEKAAKSLKGMGFDLFYQANNTAFTAGALLRLWKITGNKLYLRISNTCLANVFRNMHLWECDYGYGKNFPSFFSAFPLNDAPYTAVYEEQEVFCALHDYLKHADGEEILPAIRLLAAEYIRYLVDRAPYYYPPMLPESMLADEVKIGEVDRQLWVALEDLHDGWEKSGSVGQEVYGAGNAFGILPRHYFHVRNMELLIYADYPLLKYRVSKKNEVSFHTTGSKRLCCRMMIIKTGRRRLPAATVLAGRVGVKGRKMKDGHMEYVLNGDQHIHITFHSAG